MEKIDLGVKLQHLREKMGFSQKEFAEFLDIPQPTMSGYEKNRIAPTVAVLTGIAEKCKVSLDWLCGLSVSSGSISTTGDIADFFYQLMETEEIKADIEIKDDVDMPTDTERNYVRLTFDINDREHPLNMSVYQIINKINEHTKDLESYALSKETYEMAKKQTIEYHTLPLSRKEIPELSRDELLRKRREYLEQHPYE